MRQVGLLLQQTVGMQVGKVDRWSWGSMKTVWERQAGTGAVKVAGMVASLYALAWEVTQPQRLARPSACDAVEYPSENLRYLLVGLLL